MADAIRLVRVVPVSSEHLIRVRFELDDNLLAVLRGHLTGLQRLETKLETLLMLTQETRDVLARLDAATTAVAARIETAIVKITKLELEAGDEAEILGILKPAVETLEGLAHDPNNPVPPA